MTTADFIIIGIILVFILIGVKNGFLYSLYKFASYIMSIFIAVKLAKPVAGWFRGTGIYDGINNSVEKLLLKTNISFDGVRDPSNIESIKEAVKDIPFPENIKEIIAESISSGTETTANLMNSFVDKISFFILVILCAVLLFVVLKILFWLLGFLVKGLTEIPILKQVDRIAGLIIGALLGAGMVYVICLLLTYTVTFEKFGFIYDNINDGVIAPFFYNNNILAQLFTLGKESWL